MLHVEINGDQRVIDALNQMKRRIADPKAALGEIGELLMNEYDKNFPAEGSRMLEKWKPLAKSTIKERIRLGYGPGPILYRTGKLMRGFRMDLNRTMVRIFNDVDYFRHHQLGGGNLPRRRMILSPERLKQQVVAVFIKHLRLP